MSTRRRLLLTTLAVVFTSAAPAHAALPSSGGKTIKPGSSIGGVSLGMDGEAARSRWGKGGTCDDAIQAYCQYRNSQGAELSFEIGRDRKVNLVAVRAATKDNGTPIYSGAIKRWKTKKKIRIGSRLRAVRKAYKKVKGDPSGLALVQGRKRTLFVSAAGRVRAIVITRVDAGASSAASKKKKKKKKRKVVSATFTGTGLNGSGPQVEVKVSRGKTATLKMIRPITCQPRGQGPGQIPATITGKARRLKGAAFRRGEYYRGPSAVAASMGSWTGEFGGEVQGKKTFVGSVSYQDGSFTCSGDFFQFRLTRTSVRYGR